MSKLVGQQSVRSVGGLRDRGDSAPVDEGSQSYFLALLYGAVSKLVGRQSVCSVTEIYRRFGSIDLDRVAVASALTTGAVCSVSLVWLVGLRQSTPTIGSGFRYSCTPRGLRLDMVSRVADGTRPAR